ncbi:redoxin family protein [Flavobacterium sp. XGLA_31]|uniref:redoxin family protein n=1 Tax=Flavobacterium sp. XGLA_31 TaxID=3447666 RepID=UPI003F2E793D
MKNKLSLFITALQAENIKKRGTGFYWTGALLGIISPILFMMVAIIQSNDAVKDSVAYNHYLSFTEQSMQPFAYFFFPLLIIITVSRITQLDHKNGGWQLMETQPIDKFSIYFSKFSTVLCSNLISIVSFALASLLAGWILTFAITLPKSAVLELPVGGIMLIMARLFVASLLITALQFAISVLIPSFIWSIVIGFFGLLLTVFLQPFNLVPVWYPYEILSKIAAKPQGSDLGHWFTFTDYVGLSLSIILLYIGFNWYRHKQFKAAFVKPAKRTLSLVAVLLVFGGLTYGLLRPKQMESYPKTVVAGKIDSKETFHHIYIVDKIIQDTLAVIPLQNNTFHYQFDKKVVTDHYVFVVDQKFDNNLFFGTNDSIYIEGKVNGQASEFKIKGTRLAENQMESETKFDWSMTSYYLQENLNLDRPQIITEGIYKDWKEAMEKSDEFRTVDNYIPKDDYTQRKKKLITTNSLNQWNQLLQKRAALYPNEKTTETAGIKEMKNSVSLTDESLLSNRFYFDYVISQLVASNKEDLDENTKALKAIAHMKNGSFKDKMLFWQLTKSMEEASNSAERNQLVAEYNSQFGNRNYTRKINNINRIAESLGKGKAAPAFMAVSLEGKPYILADFKGKLLVIDTWATWCGPCKQQSPYFEKMALKYGKGKNVQFLALSIDENPKPWYIDAKSKSKSVLQLHVANMKQFSKDYNIVSIPRFMMIDGNGNFVNAKLPLASDPSFERLLQKALHLPVDDE